MIDQKFQRFKALIHNLPEITTNDNITALMQSTLQEFLAAGQLLIKNNKIDNPWDFDKVILDTTGLTSIYESLSEETRSRLRCYSGYFYEINRILMKA